MRRLLLLAALVALGAADVSAQERRCDLVESTRVDRSSQGGMTLVTFTGPFAFRCLDGTELRASSGTLNDLTRDLTLVGSVYFQDPERELTADQATYNSVTGRLYATGNVVFTNRAEGSTIRGPELEYYRPMPGRPEANVVARQRPHLTLRPRDRGTDAEPLELDADLVNIFGQDVLVANGNVVITQPDLRATAQEAQYNSATGGLELRQNAEIRSERFTLAGAVVQAQLRDGVLEQVHARSDARLDGDELTVTAPDLLLFFENELLQRAVARRPERDGEGPRAVATARNFTLTADSIDALIPAQKLDRVIAIGDARGESVDTTTAPDSAAVPTDSAAATDSTLLALRELVDRDWIQGDTVVGYFAPTDSATAAAGDTAVVLERIVATGAAQSLYRIAQQGAPVGSRRGVNFLSGDQIELTFTAGELELAEVEGLRRGLYLDPLQATPGQSPAPGAPTAARPPGGD